ncbi:MAG: DMT family transporter [Candidatus Omnitrophica bacterium]|nr:DMT family transporter [Candidatus Omnitrophota bacterium]
MTSGDDISAYQPHVRYDLRTGICLVLLAMFFQALRSVLAKWLLIRGISQNEIVFFQASGALIILGPWILASRVKLKVTGKVKDYAARIIAGFLTMYLFIWCLKYTSTAKGILLNNTAPLFIPFFTMMMFGRRHSPRLFAALLTGFVGIILILKPDPGKMNLGDILGLASGFFAGLTMIFIRILKKNGEERTRTIIFHYIMSTFIISAVLSAGSWATPSGGMTWAAIAALAIVYSGFQLTYTSAFAHAPASVLSPFAYFGVVFAVFLDWGVWGTVPGIGSAAGMVLVVLGAVSAARIYDKVYVQLR